MTEVRVYTIDGPGNTFLWRYVSLVAVIHSENLDYIYCKRNYCSKRLVRKWKKGFRLVQCVDTMIGRWLNCSMYVTVLLTSQRCGDVPL